jgi:hypothetical protein
MRVTGLERFAGVTNGVLFACRCRSRNRERSGRDILMPCASLHLAIDSVSIRVFFPSPRGLRRKASLATHAVPTSPLPTLLTLCRRVRHCTVPMAGQCSGMRQPGHSRSWTQDADGAHLRATDASGAARRERAWPPPWPGPCVPYRDSGARSHGSASRAPECASCDPACKL